MSVIYNSLSVALPGVRLLEPQIYHDQRGAFVKTYHEDALKAAGIHFAIKEEYYTVSGRGVIRGMHFQTPPADHAKLIYCISGRVRDVLLDLRRSSPTYGHFMHWELSVNNRLMFIIPSGIAHGFLSLEDQSVMVYKTTTVHSPNDDAGIRWDSFGFVWGEASPVVSTRDLGFPTLADFVTPFV